MVATFITFLALFSSPGAAYLIAITVGGVLTLPRFTNQVCDKNPIKTDREGLRIAIVIPAHNEEAVLAQTLIHVNNCLPNSGTHDVWTVVDNCTDDTHSIAIKHGSSVLVRNNPNQRGKSYALNYAFKTLENQSIETGHYYDVFVVLDADTHCQDNLLIEVESAFRNGADAVQLVNLIETNKDNRYSMLTGLGFIAMNLLRPRVRQKFGLSAGLFGTGFALSNKVLTQCPYDTHSIVEDAEYHIKLLHSGYKSILLEY